MRPGSAASTFRITSNDVTLIRDIVARTQAADRSKVIEPQ
jgi:hypothetical protein